MSFPLRSPKSCLLHVLATALLTAMFSQESLAEDGGEEFIRFHRLARAKANLETSISKYRDPSGRSLTLVGAVHVADESYFRAIQDELDRHDVVLYEMVGTPDEKRSERMMARLSLIGELQRDLAELLEVHHQSAGIDYQRPNLVHADLTMKQFGEALAERGESLIPAEGLMRILAPFMRLSFAMTRSMRATDPQLVNRMRWQMGRTLSDMGRLLDQLGIDENENPDDVIVGVRNQHAWQVFQRSLEDGYQSTAIFYGAAHMPDFQRRLLDDGWQLESRHWVPAWHIPVPPDTLEPRPPRRSPREATL